jgi:hypothetical protein
MVSEVIIYNVSGLIYELRGEDKYMEEVNELSWKVDESFEEEGAEPTYIEALQHFIVADWFADELEKRGEIVDKDFLGLTVWGRPTYGQAISLDYVVQDILKDIVERRKANG